MKKLTLIILSGIVFSCNNEPATNNTMQDTTATAPSTTMNYPYTIEHPDNWEIGSNANTMIALNSLKAWEEGNMDESLKYFGDTILVQFDGIDKKMSNDSLKAFFNEGYNSFKNVKENMTDWVSVISKDKSEEWVTIWYTQSFETKDGVKDSVDIINDMQLKDGKIIRISEYTKKLHL